jgi:hypothetical protein
MFALGERSFMLRFLSLLASILTGSWASSGLEMDPDGRMNPRVDSGLEMDPNG